MRREQDPRGNERGAARRAAASMALLALLLLPACAPVDVEGDWSGTWRTPLDAYSGTLSMSLTQDGDSFEGTFELDGTACVGEGSVTGTIDRRQFNATLKNGIGGEIVLDGDVNADSTKISGDFEVTGGFCEDAKGSFEVES